MCSHFAGVCPDEEFDSTPYAMAIARFFLRNPVCQNLPRKFKINFACCSNHGLVRIADIGLIPMKKDGTRFLLRREHGVEVRNHRNVPRRPASAGKHQVIAPGGVGGRQEPGRESQRLETLRRKPAEPVHPIAIIGETVDIDHLP